LLDEIKPFLEKTIDEILNETHTKDSLIQYRDTTINYPIQRLRNHTSRKRTSSTE
jgi:hypothetical protein